MPLTTDQTHRLDIWKQYSYQLSYPARAEVCSKHQGYSTPDFLSQDKTNGKKKTMLRGNLFKMNFETNVEEEKTLPVLYPLPEDWVVQVQLQTQMEDSSSNYFK